MNLIAWLLVLWVMQPLGNGPRVLGNSVLDLSAVALFSCDYFYMECVKPLRRKVQEADVRQMVTTTIGERIPLLTVSSVGSFRLSTTMFGKVRTALPPVRGVVGLDRNALF